MISEAYQTLIDDDKRKMYWEDYNLATKAHQLLMNHEVGRSLDYLESKIFSKNPFLSLVFAKLSHN